ncbi:MAG: hypothetical protein DMG22_21245 [Acidobacteria bacterium]|nr:MAG: hypothetical protein DMG22_21245 [Acidobacteriota bacterium]
MARIERIREAVQGLPDSAYLAKMAEAGWSLVALEWQRAIESEEAAGKLFEEVPYGLRVSNDCCHLEENPAELRVLVLMMDEIIRDRPLSRVAAALNEAGFRTRQGDLWGPIQVFNLLPRLIEVGPRIFSSADWEVRRQQIYKAV